MNAQPPSSPSPTTSLNETPLSKHVSSLMAKAKASPEPGLVLASLLTWARDNVPEADPAWLERVVEVAAAQEAEDPEALYQALAEAEPDLLAAATLPEAAHALLRLVADLIPA